ncbi:phospholipase D family protein [Sedimentitalea todarodis]|uniref:Phospholipase D n=1 Tax=Sedimentitalea todarodis TaxID=1631240 RepID=A0ABU3VHX4_9RHOB|nr:phospholipase D-like domain-containing protein [Sedimentitalea todarodis]MDU9005797.1 phospholipase D-like domain-containing protein [Sedimentitalea todarodis]
MSVKSDTNSSQDFKILVTAQEAYPEFERLCLAAQSEIMMSFRVFDPWTRLRSPEARAIGETWVDLIEHLLRRGIRIRLTISDFDPVALPDAHRGTWSAIRALHAAGDLSGRPDLLKARAVMHPAQLGWLPRLLLWPRACLEQNRIAARLSDLPLPHQDNYLREAPRLRTRIKAKAARLVARVWPIPQLHPATHHQKLAVFDRETLYIGGLDLNERRYDGPDHDRPADDTWHDVQIRMRGPAAEAALRHLQSFEAVTHGAAPPDLTGILRTISRKRRWSFARMSPKTVLREIAETHAKRTATAKRLIYLETQYFRDTGLARQLARRARNNPELGLILILPAAPEEVAFDHNPSSVAKYGEYIQAKSVRLITEAFGDRVFIGSPAQTRKDASGGRASLYGAPIIYVHSKVSIFDDDIAVVSSANLNGRSLKWDTEAGICLTDQERIRELWVRCASQWLGPDAGEDCLDPVNAVAAWRLRAQANARVEPEERTGFILPYASRPARRFGHTLPGIPEEMV